MRIHLKNKRSNSLLVNKRTNTGSGIKRSNVDNMARQFNYLLTGSSKPKAAAKSSKKKHFVLNL